MEKNNESGNDDEVGIEHEIVWMEMERGGWWLRQRCKLPFWCVDGGVCEFISISCVIEEVALSMSLLLLFPCRPMLSPFLFFSFLSFFFPLSKQNQKEER